MVLAFILLNYLASASISWGQDLPAAVKALDEGQKAIQKLEGPCAKCEAQKAAKKVEGLFDSRTVLELKIRGHFSVGLKDKGQDKAQQEATQSDGELLIGSPYDQKISVRLERRGWARGGCEIPLMKVIWDKKAKDVQGTLLDPLKDNDMKWVSDCSLGQTREILLEYFAQRAMELSSFPALRVRLAKVTYEDLDNRGKKTFRGNDHYGYFLEPDKDVEHRLKVTVVPVKKFAAENNSFDLTQNPSSDMTLAIPGILLEDLFQNEDYKVWENKNTVVLMKKMDLKKEDFKKTGSYAGFLPYDMTLIPGRILNYSMVDWAQVLNKSYAGGHGSWSNGERVLLKGSPDYWHSEWLKYAQILETKEDIIRQELKALPSALPSNVDQMLADYFTALRAFIQSKKAQP
ncbi:MAG: hypothetical protein JNL01_07940 [Bdellovibrionales bacterium]|nr:hypothetical protein [Bdellovibrionales bacterium]